jgi:aspartate/methionine/tyrosine aminotransferase
MRILERAQALEAAGRDIIHLEVGEPRFPLPELLLEAARHALTSAPMGYTPSPGLPALRRAIASHYGRRYGIALDPARVIVTPGGSGALQLALAASVAVGDRVMVAEPGYPCHRYIAALTGAEVYALTLSAAAGWRATAAGMGAAWQAGTRAFVFASPGNPTGVVLEPAEIAALYDVVRERGGGLVVDETYQGLVYDATDTTALAAGDDGLFVVNSFSKYFGLTGWRLGWLVVPPGWPPIVERLAQNLFLAAPTLSQHVATAALSPDVLALLEQRRDMLRRRRDLLLAVLPQLGFSLPTTPAGAFYVFAALPPEALDAPAFAVSLLDAAGVAVAPGVDFGGAQAARMLRLAYTEDESRLREACNRVAAFSYGG